MSGNYSKSPADAFVLFLLALVNGAVLEAGMVQDSRWYSLLYITVPLFIWMLLKQMVRHNRRRTRRCYQEVFDRFSRHAERQGLRFSSQVRLRNGMLGLDVRKGKLLVCQRLGKSGFQSRVVLLQEIEACTLLGRQGLRLHFQAPRHPVDLVFYRAVLRNQQATLPMASCWARLLGQLLRTKAINSTQ